MNPITVIALVACLSFTSAQLADTSSTGTGNLGTTSGTGLFSGGGPLSLLGNTAGNTNTMDAMGADSGMGATTGATGTTGAGQGAASNVNPLLSNPMVSYGLMGGDNLMRAMMAPYMSRFGNTAGLYYLRGGMDTFSKVLMADTVNRMLSRSMGMDPLMSAFFSGQLTDAPDNYALSNMIMNGGMNRWRQQGGMQSGTAGMMSNGGSPNSVGAGNSNQFNPMLLYPFLAM